MNRAQFDFIYAKYIEKVQRGLLEKKNKLLHKAKDLVLTDIQPNKGGLLLTPELVIVASLESVATDWRKGVKNDVELLDLITEIMENN